MSTLEVNKFKKGAKELDSDYLIGGSAKAWMNLDGTGTIEVQDSLNTSSVTDDGTGLYTQSFTSDMNGANYSAVVAGKEAGTSTFTGSTEGTTKPNNLAAGSLGISCHFHVNNVTSRFHDVTLVSTSVMGDLA